MFRGRAIWPCFFLPMKNLFENQQKKPLAELLRPSSLEGFYGQEHLLSSVGPIRKYIHQKFLPSLILWGPSGTGKTTLAHLISKEVEAEFFTLSAVSDRAKDIKEILDKAKSNFESGLRTLLFIDEIHRFNKSQQDIFLPVIEAGEVILVGATTENPSFEMNKALLSRCQVYRLLPLTEVELRAILKTAENFLGKKLLEPNLEACLIDQCDGDARKLINRIEILSYHDALPIADEEDLFKALQEKSLSYDKRGEAHYNLISAFHKSIRGSDVQASIYWLSRMLKAGEDPLFIARRLIRMAYEDIGLSDWNAPHQALMAYETYNMLGSPEGEIALYQATIYLAACPKSNAVYNAEKESSHLVEKTSNFPPPDHILNAPTSMMKKAGIGEGYQYDHDYPFHISPQEYLPANLKGVKVYSPTEQGLEARIKERMSWIHSKKNKK